ncbi:MAG: tape measure protein [Syntrophorhabdaceae bacterium]
MAKLGTVFVELALDDKIYKQKLSETLTSTEATAKGIETSWKTLGTRSNAVFDAQRRSIENSFTLIKNSASSTANDIIRAEEAKLSKLKQLNDQQYGAHVTMTEKIKANWAEIAGSAYLAYKAFDIGKQAVEAALKMEQITYSMKAVSGSSQIAAQELAYVKAESERLGLVMSDTALAFAKFSAATRNTSIEGQETKKVFSAVAEAATALKLPGEQVNGIFMALQQMMSKGKVQAEELRGQLGERLPGAFNMAAEAMGVSTAKLNEMLERGEVLGSVLLPLLAEKLHETYGQAAKESAEGGQAAINRFNNAVFESKAALGDTLMPILVESADVFKTYLVPAVQAAIFGVQTLALEVMGLIDKWGIWNKSFANPIDFAIQSSFNTEDYKKYAAEVAVIDKRIADSRADLHRKMNPGAGMGEATAVLGYEAGTYTWEDPAKIKKGKKGGTDNYSNILRQITDETKTWKDRIVELDPYLTKEDSQILKLNNDIDNQIKKIQDQADKSKKYTVETADFINTLEGLRKEGIANITEANWLKGQQEFEKMMSEEAEYGINENERAANAIIAKETEKMNKLKDLWWDGKITDEQFNEAEVRIHGNAAAAKLDKETEYARKVAGIRYNNLEHIKGMEEEAFALKMQLIDAEAARRIKDGADEITTALWANNEKQNALVEYAKKSDSVTAGMAAAWHDLYKDQMTWGRAAYETTIKLYDQMSDALGDGFFDVLTGNLEDLDDLWEDTWKSMLKTMTSYLGKMVMDAAAKEIVLMFKSEWTEGGGDIISGIGSVLGIVGNWLGGGSSYSNDDFGYINEGADFGSGSDILAFSSGGRVPGPASNVDSVAAWLAPGEHVVPASLVAAAGRGGDTMLAHINPAEAAILKMLGGSGTVNPRTGLPEFYNAEQMALFNPTNQYQEQSVNISGVNMTLDAFGNLSAGPGIMSNYTLDSNGYYYQKNMPVGGYDYTGHPIYGTIDPFGGFNPVDSGTQKYLANQKMLVEWNQILASYPAWKRNFAMKNLMYYDMNARNMQYYANQDGTITALWGVTGLSNPAGLESYTNENPETPWHIYRLDRNGSVLSDYAYEGIETTGNEYAPYFIAAGSLLTGGILGGAFAGLGGFAGVGGGILGASATAGGLAAATSALNQQVTTGQVDITQVGTAALLAGGTAALGSWLAGASLTGAGNAGATLAHEADHAAGVDALIVEAAEQYPSVFTGSIYESNFWGGLGDWMTSGDMLDTGLNYAKRQILKMAVKTGMNTLLGGDDDGNGARMKISYMGADDGGLLESLSRGMDGLGGRFAFSAANGLDYVPRDNFLINAHKGEAVLTAKENEKRMSGNEKIVVHNHLYIDGKEIKTLADQVVVERNQRGVSATQRVY